MAFGLSKRSWKKVLRNLSLVAAMLFLFMVLTPTHHETAPVFSEDGTFQVSSQEFVKHFKMSKWKMPAHELLHVKDFYDYIENPRTSCESSVVLGGRACHELDDHTVCLDQSLGMDHDSCLVYSFGDNSKSFESVMTKLGCDVHTFDPASAHRTDHRRGERSWYYRIRLAGNASALLPNDKELTLQEVRRQLGHTSRQVDYLQLDLEGDEWPALRRMMSTRVLDDVQQLGVQAALDVHQLAPRQRLAQLRDIYHVLVGLEHSGLRLVSSRPQGAQLTCRETLAELDADRRVCPFYELVFARRSAAT